MIIGFDASRANKDAKTGTEWYSYNLLLELAKIDNKNRYFLYTPQKLKKKLKKLPDNFEEKVLGWPPKYLWTMIRLSLEMILKAPDILFVPAHIIPLISPKNTITTIMDVGFISRPEIYPKKELKYHKFGLQQAIKKAKIILTISEFTKQEMIDLCGIDPNRIKVINLGFDSGIFKKIEDRGRINKVLGKYSIPTDSQYFLYVGRLEEKKNTPGLVEAFGKLLKENQGIKHKLVLAGAPGHNYEEIKSLIDKYNLQDNVIETGWVEEEDLAYLFNGSFAFVFPSFYEGFGIPLLEAMSCEVPILASEVASIPEVALDAAIYFDPNNIEDIKDKMKDSIENDSIRLEVIEKGKQRVKEFGWEKCARETLREIEKIKK